MENLIDKVFSTPGMKIMAHAVIGYPDIEISRENILALGESSGADLIEIQIPFSDPLADGPAIMRANQVALDKGITPVLCFKKIREITELIDVPVLVMTYINIVHKMGMKEFIRKSRQAGVSGLIIPDLPYDAEQAEEYYTCSKKYNIYPIHVVSPGMADTRLQEVVKRSVGFIYSTLKVGITGAEERNEEQGVGFIARIKKHTFLPVLAGFGISSPGQVKELRGIADGVIIGSHLINLYNQKGIRGVKDFLTSLGKIIDR